MSEIYISLSGLVISNGPYEHTLTTGDKLYDVGFQFRVTVQQTNITKTDLDRVRSFVKRGNVLISNLEEICELARKKPDCVLPCHQLYYRPPHTTVVTSNNANPSATATVTSAAGAKSVKSVKSVKNVKNVKNTKNTKNSANFNGNGNANEPIVLSDDDDDDNEKNGDDANNDRKEEEEDHALISNETKNDEEEGNAAAPKEGKANESSEAAQKGQKESGHEVVANSDNEELDDESMDEEEERDLEDFCAEFGTTEELEKMRVEDVLGDTERGSAGFNCGRLFSIQKPKNFSELDLSEQLRCSLENIKEIHNHERKFASVTDAATSTARVPENLLFMVSQSVLSAAKEFVSKVECPQGFVPSLVVVPVSVTRESEGERETKPRPERKDPRQMSRVEAKVLEEYYGADASGGKKAWVTGAIRGGLRGVQVRELGKQFAGASRGGRHPERERRRKGDDADDPAKNKKRSGKSVLRRGHKRFLAQMVRSKGKMSVGDVRAALEEKFPELRGDEGEHKVSLPSIYCLLRSIKSEEGVSKNARAGEEHRK